MVSSLVGQTLGRYRVTSQLGKPGGMGAVYKAFDPRLKRDVAIKIMHPQFAQQPQFRQRFLQEAQVAAQLDHPGIVKVHDFASDQAHALLYIVMEFIPGENLGEMLHGLQNKHEWIALPEAVQLIRQLCLAMEYLHSQGVLHRDMKPANIMLKAQPSDGLPYRPVITDLGLAKLAKGGVETQSGMSMGTPPYMSPEQALAKQTDARSDVYSLGVLFYELATGRLPFPFQSSTEATLHYNQPTPPPPAAPHTLHPDLPMAVESVILKAMQLRPDDRFADMKAMAASLATTLPAATAVTSAPTEIEKSATLLTELQNSLVATRGSSILGEFPPSVDAAQDVVQILEPDHTVRSVACQAAGLTIGRDADNDIALDRPKISRHHARIDFDGTNYRVTDLNSTNGTFLAGVKLLPNMPEVWPPDKPLRIGDLWLHVVRARSTMGSRIAGTMVDATHIETSAGDGRVGLFLEQAQFAVEPGSCTTVPIIIINQGTLVDHFQTAIEGVPAAWVQLPEPVELFAGDQQTAQISLRPPRAPQSRAGRYPVSIRVTSRDKPDEVAETKITLTVAAFSQFSSKLHPQRITVGQTAQVAVSNLGNTPETFNLTWQDRANELAFDPPQTQLPVKEGQTAAAEFRASSRRRRWIGGEKTHVLAATVKAAHGEPQMLSGEVVSKGLIPTWVLPLAVILAVLLCGTLYALFVKLPVIENVAIDPPNPLPNTPVTLSWRVSNCQSVEVRNGATTLARDLPCVGTYRIDQGFTSKPVLYVIASNSFAPIVGVARATQEVVPVTPTPTPTPELPPPDVFDWSVGPAQITRGESVTITWKVSDDADSVTLEPFGTVKAAGQMQDTPQQTKTYRLLVTRKGKSVQKSQEVVVQEPLPDVPVVNTFTVEPGEVVKGQGTTVRLTWDTANADTVTIEPGLGTVGLSGNRDVPVPESDTTYTLVAKGPGGETKRQIQLKVTEQLCTVIYGSLNLRSGPGMIYDPPIRELPNTAQLEPLAYNPTGFPEGPWIKVRVKQTGEEGWVSAKPQYVSCNFNVTNLSSAVAPPTPTPTPTPAPQSSVSNVRLAPASPATLSNDEYVNIDFNYTTSEAGGVRIWARPFTAGALSAHYAASGSPLYNPGSGTGSGRFTITSGMVIVDQIRFQMWNADQSKLLYETFISVNYTFTSGASSLVAPTLLSPANGTVFNIYPRTTTLQWSAVSGAVKYRLERDYVMPGQTCPQGASNYGVVDVVDTSFTFNFVGAQPGCWRVWAVDANGQEGPKSDWWMFRYTR